MDDTQLVLRLADDLDATFELLVRAHVDRCHSIALRVLGDRHEAEDATQEALVRAYRALAGYERERIRELRLRPWLATIVLNLCRSRLHRRGPAHLPLGDLVDAGREPAADEAEGPGASALRTLERERLADLVAALPERYRVPLVLRHVDDLSYAELAEVLGRPEGTLKAQVHRGLALLRASMTPEDIEELTA